MKHLVITRLKGLFFTPPPETQMELMETAGVFMNNYRKAGKCKEIYVLPGLKIGESIWETESAE